MDTIKENYKKTLDYAKEEIDKQNKEVIKKIEESVDEFLDGDRNEKGWLKCDYCGEYKQDVESRSDPYAYEINEDDDEYNICDDCYNESAMEI